MPEFRLVPEIDGVPTSIRPTDARFGSAVGAAPVVADGVADTIANHLQGKASLDPDTGKVLQAQIDLSKGGDYQVALGLPATLTIAEEVKARGVVPAARLGITGGTADQTTKWQTAIGDALLTYKRPVELNLGLSHRVGSRLQFPAGSGIVNPGGASVTGDCSDFNNTSFDIGLRYGSNAVMLSAAQGAAGVRFEGIKLTLTAANAAAFKGRIVQGIVLRGCPDAVVIDADVSGFNAGSMINIQSCKNFRLERPHCHDGISHSSSTSPIACQLTAILIDGDEIADGSGNKVGSSGTILFARISDIRSTSEVIGNVGDQTDGINVAGSFASIQIFHPNIRNVAEALDIFGNVKMAGGRIFNTGNFSIKLVHGAQGCRISDFFAENIGIAGVTMQSTSSELRDVSNNEVRGAIKNIGVLNIPALTVNGVSAPALNAGPIPAADAVAVLLNETSPAYPVQGNVVEVNVEAHGLPTRVIRTTTTGGSNIVRYTNNDGTTDGKENTLSGANLIRRTDKTTSIRAYAAAAQSFPTSATVIAFATEASDPFSEWSGTVFTPKFAGTYQVAASIRFAGTAASDTLTMSLRQNGTQKKVAGFGNVGGGLSGFIQHSFTMAVGDTVDATALLSVAQSNSPGEIFTAITINRLPD